jgi:hypothetical protein
MTQEAPRDRNSLLDRRHFLNLSRTYERTAEALQRDAEDGK